MLSTISFTIDSSQTRRKKRHNEVVLQGSYPDTYRDRSDGFSRAYSDLESWWDPVTFSGMPRPGPMYPEFASSAAGIFSRLQKTDFNFTDPSRWKDNSQSNRFTGDYYLIGTNLENHLAITVDSWEANQGFFLSWYTHSAGDDEFEILRAGWNDTGSFDEGVHVRYFHGGRTEIWKDGVKVGEYRLSGSKSDQQLGNTWPNVMMIPGRRRELLVISNRGGGFSHVFEDLPESQSDNIITGAGKFWFFIPGENRRAAVQVVPIRYQTSCKIIGRPNYFAYAPKTSDIEADPIVYWDGGEGTGVTARMVEADSITDPFEPDGSKIKVRIELTLTNTTTQPVFVYGAICGYKHVVGETSNLNEVEITDYIHGAALTVSEAPEGVSLVLDLLNPEGASGTLSIANLTTGKNRVLTLSADSGIFLDGISNGPKYTPSSNPEMDRVEMEVRDFYKLLQNYKFSEIRPLDGFTLKEALIDLLDISIGFTNVDIEDSDFRVPYGQNISLGEWGTLVRVGDSAADSITQLMENFAGNWFYGFVPTSEGIQFVAKSPEGMGTSVDRKLWLTVEEAYSELIGEGWGEAEARNLVRQRSISRKSLRFDTIEQEATEVRVTGIDPRTGRPIQAFKKDYDAENIELDPFARPSNWVGEDRLYGLFDSNITTMDAVKRAVRLLYKRLTRHREMVEFRCNMLFNSAGIPLWRGSVVEIDGYGKYRIQSMRVDFRLEPNTGGTGRELWYDRRATYTAEKIYEEDTTCPPRSSGSTLDEMKALAEARPFQIIAVRRDSSSLQKNPAQIIEEVID